MAHKKSGPLLKVSDRVRILHFGGQRGRIVEVCGPRRRAEIYCVRISQKARPTYIEVREDQLVLIPVAAD